MERSRILVCPVGVELPVVETPFAVLLDADDLDWADAHAIRRLGRTLLSAGCRYFVCFGRRSELVHDVLDDVVIEDEYHGVTTTFHDEETKEDVSEFLINCATVDMKGALVFVRNFEDWEMHL
jgi:hypothetical protein